MDRFAISELKYIHVCCVCSNAAIPISTLSALIFSGNDNDFIAKLVEDTKKAEEEQYQGKHKPDLQIREVIM